MTPKAINEFVNLHSNDEGEAPQSAAAAVSWSLA